MMKLLIVVIFAVLATSARAQGMMEPRVVAAPIDWSEIRGSVRVPDGLEQILASPGQPPLRRETRTRVAEERNQLGLLNKAVSQIFPNIAVSPVPVLLPLDTDAFLAALVSGNKGNTRSYMAGFSRSKFFLPGPAGYDAAFVLDVAKVPSLDSLAYRKSVELEISGSSVLYELTGPASPAGAPVAELQGRFPGLTRVLYDGALRYTFVRHRAPYVISVQCANRRGTSRKGPPKKISCAEAEQVAAYFLNTLRFAGGTPNNRPQAAVAPAIDRPARNSRSFSFRSPGDLIPNSGYRGNHGSKDRTVYAAISFPVNPGPVYANSQEFMSGGKCYGQALEPKPANKDDVYRCDADGKQLVYNEGIKDNFAYPWRDNFCEIRDWDVGQCPGGHGHQGQDIRPGPCRRVGRICEPYRHNAIAVRDAYVVRSAGQESVYLLVNAPNEHIRFRYLHMSPERMDNAGLITGRMVKEGEKIGEVGNYYERENGTTYHLHFDIQVPTKNGWVWVNPYMTLVAAYEQHLKAKGAELGAAPP
jgi:murein DD-endopeptidase MepM/ murein hydrolase activator NlpD